jgi:hypothetical protein
MDVADNNSNTDVLAAVGVIFLHFFCVSAVAFIPAVAYAYAHSMCCI